MTCQNCLHAVVCEYIDIDVPGRANRCVSYKDRAKYEERKHGSWIMHGRRKNRWCECSECHAVGSPQWKSCPVCDTKMVPSDESP